MQALSLRKIAALYAHTFQVPVNSFDPLKVPLRIRDSRHSFSGQVAEVVFVEQAVAGSYMQSFQALAAAAVGRSVIARREGNAFAISVPFDAELEDFENIDFGGDDAHCADSDAREAFFFASRDYSRNPRRKEEV